MVYCSKCGHKVEKEDIFCPKCGNKIRNEVSRTKNEQTHTLWQDVKALFKAKKKAIGTFILIISLFLILCAVIDLIQSGGQSSQSWRDGSMRAPSGQLDITLIFLSVFGIFISIKCLKTNKK